MKWIVMMTTCLMLSGCLGSRVDFSDLGTAAGSVIGAGASAAVGLPPLAVITTTALGATAGAVLVDEPDSLTDVIDSVPEEERADVLKAHSMWEAIESLGWWIVMAVLAFFLLPLIIGYFIPRGSERRMKQMLFDDPNYTTRDMK